MSKSLYRNLVTVPNASTDSLNDGETVGGDIIKNDKALADKVLAVEAAKQDTLVSGTNIKTVNNTSILGSGNISIPAGDAGDSCTASVTSTTGGHNLTITNTISGTTTTETVLIPDGQGSGWNTSTDSSSTTCTYALTNGGYKIFSNAAITSLEVTNSFTSVGDTALVEFTSPSTAATYDSPSGTKHYGDDCSSDVFTPAESTTYLLTYLKTNQGLRCFVKSI